MKTKISFKYIIKTLAVLLITVFLLLVFIGCESVRVKSEDTQVNTSNFQDTDYGYSPILVEGHTKGSTPK